VDADNLPAIDSGDLGHEFVMDYAVKDKNGRTVCLFTVGDWNLRRKALRGEIADVSRRLNAMEEKLAQLNYNQTGDPSSFLIADFTGLCLRKHLCAGCKTLLSCERLCSRD